MEDPKKIVGLWCDWYIRPFVFPWEYPDLEVKLSIQDKIKMKMVDFKKYYEVFVGGMQNELDKNQNLMDCFNKLSESKSDGDATAFYSLMWGQVEKFLMNKDKAKVALDNSVNYFQSKGRLGMMFIQVEQKLINDIELHAAKMHNMTMQAWSLSWKDWLEMIKNA